MEGRGVQEKMLDVYDSQSGELLRTSDDTLFGKDTEEAKSTARELGVAIYAKTRYRRIPPWNRNITDSVWLNDYFRNPGMGYQEPFDIPKYTTEVFNGFRFACEARGYLVYDISSRNRNDQFWRAWSGTCWKKAINEPTVTGKLIHNALSVEHDHYEKQLSIFGETDKVLQKQRSTVLSKLEKHFQATGKKTSIENMIALSASEPGMAVDINGVYDRNLIGCKNGIIDTLNGVFIPIEEITDELKNRFPIHYIDCTYIPNAPRPDAFLSHLEMQFTDNTTEGLSTSEINYRCSDSLRAFLRLLGYLLVAGNPERIFIFMWGRGRNGKSTTLEVLRNILGDEYGEGKASELCAKGSDSPSPRMTEGIGRLVLSFPEMSDNGESDKGDGRISIEAIKLLTGEKSTTFFRKMGGYDGRQDILCTPIAATNDFPQYNKIPDQALLDRIITIPHNHRIPKEEIDTQILGKLMQEKDLIFSLVVDQCFAYLHGILWPDGTVREKEGLVDIPKFWIEEQARAMIGDGLYDYIKGRFVKSDNRKSLDFTAIKNDYISYLLVNNIENPKPYRDYKGYDCNYPPYTISKAEISKLKKALICCGFEIYESHGHTYINADLSKAALKNWNPNPIVN